jgi:hypothetical protein
MRSLLYLTGRTPSPFPTEPEQFRILDAGLNVLLDYKHPVFGNFAQSFFMSANVSGQTFILEEWDASTFFRFRTLVDIVTTPEPAAFGMTLAAISLFLGVKKIQAGRR